MNRSQTFEQFLALNSVQIPVLLFIINLILAGVLAIILRWVYIRYGSALSDRKSFGNNFFLMTMTTMLIISIVKSSLALSLGLVGALSIVRFRAAIKEPEELAYLFLAISIGLGFGANQGVITVVAFLVIMIAIILNSNATRKDQGSQNLHLLIQSKKNDNFSIESVVELLKKTCSEVSLKRIDENTDSVEASFLVAFPSFEDLNEAKKSLQNLSSDIQISFIENRGMI